MPDRLDESRGGKHRLDDLIFGVQLHRFWLAWRAYRILTAGVPKVRAARDGDESMLLTVELTAADVRHWALLLPRPDKDRQPYRYRLGEACRAALAAEENE